MHSAPGTPVPLKSQQTAPTAVKVKGKKSHAARVEALQFSGSSDEERNRKRRRAQSFHGADGLAAAVKRPTNPQHDLPLRRSLRIRGRRGLANIETLPTEVLERIFFYCLDPSFDLGLLRASPVIAIRLSNPYIFSEYCKKAFIHARDKEGVQYTVVRGGRPVWDPDMAKGRNQALRCKWMTLEYFQQLRQRVSTDAQQYVQSLKYLSTDAKRTKCLTDWPILNLRTSHVPSKLLKTPITDEKIEFLNMLAHANTEIDTVNSCATEDVSELWQSAVVGKHWPLLRMLMSKPFSFIPNKTTIQMAVMAVDFDPNIIWNIHTAIMEREGSRSVYHGEWCLRHFPYSDTQVMTALNRHRGDAPSCWIYR